MVGGRHGDCWSLEGVDVVLEYAEAFVCPLGEGIVSEGHEGDICIHGENGRDGS